MFNLLLIKYTDGAVYSVIVQALVTPLATIFWTLFKAEPTFTWFPVFDQSTVYVLGGLTIMMPSVIMYTVFSGDEEQSQAALGIRATPDFGKLSVKILPSGQVVRDEGTLRRINSEPTLF